MDTEPNVYQDIMEGGIASIGGMSLNMKKLTSITANPGLHRPYFNRRGIPCAVINGKHVQNTQTGEWEREQLEYPIEALKKQGLFTPVMNATTLTKQAWQQLDALIVEARRTRLRAWTDAVAAVPHAKFNAYRKTVVEYHSSNDPGEAIVDMNGISEGRSDTPQLILSGVPLPITHSDYFFTDRDIEVSLDTGMPLPMTMARDATRRVMETIEDTLIGTVQGITYGTQSSGPGAYTGNSTVHGYTNFTYKVSKTDLTAPTGTNPEAINTDVLEMIETMQTNGYYGPYMLYHSTPYSRYLADDYYRSGSTSAVRSVRDRIMENPELVDVRRLDRLTSGYQMIMVQWNDPEVMEMIDGMPPTMLQWDEKGGLLKKFKVWGIQVPMLKKTYSSGSGILHATTS